MIIKEQKYDKITNIVMTTVDRSDENIVWPNYYKVIDKSTNKLYLVSMVRKLDSGEKFILIKLRQDYDLNIKTPYVCMLDFNLLAYEYMINNVEIGQHVTDITGEYPEILVDINQETELERIIKLKEEENE